MDLQDVTCLSTRASFAPYIIKIVQEVKATGLPRLDSVFVVSKGMFPVE